MADPDICNVVNDVLLQAASVQPDITPPISQSSGGPSSNQTKSSVWLGVHVARNLIDLIEIRGLSAGNT